jgi:hypothetical protein
MHGAIPPLPCTPSWHGAQLKSTGILPFTSCYVGPCYHGISRPRVADGGDGLQLWTADVTIY